MTLDLCIMAYGNPARLAQVVRVLPAGIPTRVVESPTIPEVGVQMEATAAAAGLPFSRCPVRGEMQDTANFIVATSTADWVLFWPDDVLPSAGAWESFAQHLTQLPEHVGAAQAPYWNYLDLPAAVRPPTDNIILACPDLAWLAAVPRNPSWEIPTPMFYINCNGAGFAVRRDAWNAVGGVSPHTWCFDEDIACRLWVSGTWTVMSVPGPPLVHQGAGSAPDRQTFGIVKAYSHDTQGWLMAWEGRTKEDLNTLSRATMAYWAARTGIPAR